MIYQNLRKKSVCLVGFAIEATEKYEEHKYIKTNKNQPLVYLSYDYPIYEADYDMIHILDDHMDLYKLQIFISFDIFVNNYK